MTRAAVQAFAERVTADPAFKEKLTKDWDGALEEYDFTPDERGMLSRLRLDEIPLLAHGIGIPPLGDGERRDEPNAPRSPETPSTGG